MEVSYLVKEKRVLLMHLDHISDSISVSVDRCPTHHPSSSESELDSMGTVARTVGKTNMPRQRIVNINFGDFAPLMITPRNTIV